MNAEQMRLHRRIRKEQTKKLYASMILGNSTDLASFKRLPMQEQCERLLKRIACFYGHKAFDPRQAPVWLDGICYPGGLAFGFPLYEESEASRYLLCDLWTELVHSRQVARACSGEGMHEITGEGWALLKRLQDAIFLSFWP